MDSLFVTILAIALDSCPIIFSPINALALTAAVDANSRISKLGCAPVGDIDSYTDKTLTTSGTFKDISSS